MELTLSIIVPYITLKNEYVTKLNLEGLMGLTEWEILEDTIYYDRIKPEILKIKFSSYMGYNATL